MNLEQTINSIIEAEEMSIKQVIFLFKMGRLEVMGYSNLLLGHKDKTYAYKLDGCTFKLYTSYENKP